MKKFMALLIVVLIFPLCINIEGKAAKTPSLSVEKMTIGIGSYGADENGYYSKDQKYYLSVRNSKKGATYTFTSKDKKIVTVKKEGSKAYITGVKAGKTAITVKQKLNGKTTTIGTCNITVKNAKLVVDKELLAEYELGTDFFINKRTLKINNYNPAAKYTFNSNKEGIVIKQKKYEDEGLGMNFYHTIYTATKPGIYKITVKETYKKKTRKVGTFSITIVSPKAQETYELYMNETVLVPYDLVSALNNAKYWVSNEGYEDIITLSENEYGVTMVSGLKPGTAVITYYYDDNGKKGKKFGSTKITVKVEDISKIGKE